MNERTAPTPSQPKILSLPAETQFAPDGVVSRTLLRTPLGRVVLFGFADGQELTEHTSTTHVLVQVLTGRCEWRMSGETQVLHEGHLVYLPPNLPHAVRALGPLSLLLTVFDSAGRRAPLNENGPASDKKRLAPIPLLKPE